MIAEQERYLRLDEDSEKTMTMEEETKDNEWKIRKLGDPAGSRPAGADDPVMHYVVGGGRSRVS